MTGMEELAERDVEHLSGGQLQRVWLASCLAQETGVLLLDEPTTYLDLRYQVELRPARWSRPSPATLSQNPASSESRAVRRSARYFL